MGEVNELQKLAEGLLELSSHTDSVRLGKIKLNEVTREAKKILDPMAALRKIDIVSSPPFVKTIFWEMESSKLYRRHFK